MAMELLEPSIHDRDNATVPVSYVHERGLGHVKVLARRIAPSAIVGIFRPVGRTQVCSSDGGDGRAWKTPF